MRDPLDSHDPERLARFAVTTDLVILTIRGGVLVVGLVRRDRWPYDGLLALPGGFVRTDTDSNLDRAAQRQLVEEALLKLYPQASPGFARHLHVEQLGTYWRPGRDPRPGLEVMAVAYLVVTPDLPGLVTGDGDSGVSWLPVDDVVGEGVALAFDHARIVADGVERVRASLDHAALAAAFLTPTFTVAELRRVYEVVWGRRLDPRNFHRKATRPGGFLEPTGRTTTRGRGRPAALYRCTGLEAPAAPSAGARDLPGGEASSPRAPQAPAPRDRQREWRAVSPARRWVRPGAEPDRPHGHDPQGRTGEGRPA